MQPIAIKFQFVHFCIRFFIFFSLFSVRFVFDIMSKNGSNLSNGRDQMKRTTVILRSYLLFFFILAIKFNSN